MIWLVIICIYNTYQITPKTITHEVDLQRTPSAFASGGLNSVPDILPSEFRPVHRHRGDLAVPDRRLYGISIFRHHQENASPDRRPARWRWL